MTSFFDGEGAGDSTGGGCLKVRGKKRKTWELKIVSSFTIYLDLPSALPCGCVLVEEEHRLVCGAMVHTQANLTPRTKENP